MLTMGERKTLARAMSRVLMAKEGRKKLLGPDAMRAGIHHKS